AGVLPPPQAGLTPLTASEAVTAGTAGRRSASGGGMKGAGEVGGGWGRAGVRGSSPGVYSERLEGDVRVGEAGRIDGQSGPYQGCDLVVDVPDVDVHAGQHPPAPDPERQELAPRHVAAEDHLVVAAGVDVPGVLHAQVVLVGEEVGHAVVG